MKIKIRETAEAKKGWSLYRLAKEIGASQQSIYAWQSGKTKPHFEALDLICSVLGCGVGDLLEAEPVEVKP